MFQRISTYAIPLLSILYLCIEKTRALLKPHLITIMILGILDAMYDYKTSLEKILIILGHLVIIPLLLIEPPDEKSQLNILSILGVFVIINITPYWHYKLTRNQMFYMYALLYTTLLVYNFY